MALPVLDKTWTTALNIELRTTGSALQDGQRLWFTIKQQLLAMGIPWTVVGSSNGTVAAMDGADRWVAASDLSFVNNAVSWIVLQQASINPKFQIMIRCGSTGNSNGGIYGEIKVSPVAGFGVANGGTDGSIASNGAPTATDEITLIGNTSGGSLMVATNNAATATDYILHLWQSNDGQCNRLIVFQPGAGKDKNRLFVRLDKPKNPIAAWTNPCVYHWFVPNNSLAPLTYNYFNDAAKIHGNNPNGGDMTFYATCEGLQTAMNGEWLTGSNDLSGEYEVYPQALFTLTSLAQGRHGELFDSWYLPTGIVNGMTMPLTPSPNRQFCVFDEMLMPWDGTLPVLI